MCSLRLLRLRPCYNGTVQSRSYNYGSQSLKFYYLAFYIKSVATPIIGEPKKKLSAKQKLVGEIIKQQNDVESEIEALRKRNKLGVKTAFVNNKHMWNTKDTPGNQITAMRIGLQYDKVMPVKIYCTLLNNIR